MFVLSFFYLYLSPHTLSLSLILSCPLPPQGLESCLKGPDNYNSQVLIEATVIALTKLQPLLNKVHKPQTQNTCNT